MTPQDAYRLLGLTGNINQTDVKKAYKKLAMSYHPDRNPAGVEMMKLINVAFDVLKGFEGDLPSFDNNEEGNYHEAVNEALNAIIGLADLTIEICGAWVWVSGDTRTHKETLKEVGFKYASKKKRWYFRPEGFRSRSRGTYSMDDIRNKYGSANPNTQRKSLVRG